MMWIPTTTEQHRANRHALIHGAIIWITAVLAVSLIQAAEFDGFTEPFREIDVASPEPGIIMQMAVGEGERVRTGQVLTTLDNDVHAALLAIAEQSKRTQGRLDALQAELKLRQDRAQQFQKLFTLGHARQEETEKASMELEIAEAQVKAAGEELLIKELEFRKIKVQLDRRTITSPIDGVVTELHRDLGEFVAPTAPEIMTIVQLDPLLATFSILGPYAEQLSLHQEVTLHFPVSKREVVGHVAFISPVTDAESGMVRVKVRVANPEGRTRSGERCLIQFGEEQTRPQPESPRKPQHPARDTDRTK